MDMWDELSRRCYGFDRTFLKRTVLRTMYGGETDPWLDYILMSELSKLQEEKRT